MHLRSSSLVIIGAVLFASILSCLSHVVSRNIEDEKQSNFWLNMGDEALAEALKNEPIVSRAKSGIIFIGDGMSLTTVTAARILQGQLMNQSGEENQLSFEKLKNVCLVKTYNLDYQVPDSAATATAILSGVKTNFYTVGVNGNVNVDDDCEKVEPNRVFSIIKQAQEAGKSTGVVTTTRITHATPAAAYAHSPSRVYECGDKDTSTTEAPRCKDIASQLIEDQTGSKLNVILGGGRRCFFGNKTVDPGITGKFGIRRDNRNLIDVWVNKRRAVSETNYAFVNSTKDLRDVDLDSTDYLLGLFAYSHMDYDIMRNTGPDGQPSLAEMTETAIKILSKNPEGFLLLVEGGRIDHAHHENVAGVALRETVAFSQAIENALKMVHLKETLVAVTADHSHALTMNGMAKRGNSILGVTMFPEQNTNIPYTTLMYGNGPGYRNPRPDPTQRNTSGFDSITVLETQVNHAAVFVEEAFHDGSDVAVFASGPFAHLFQGVQEQSYIAHVFSHSLCIGRHRRRPHCRVKWSRSAPLTEEPTLLQGGLRLMSSLGDSIFKSESDRDQVEGLGRSVTSSAASMFGQTKSLGVTLFFLPILLMIFTTIFALGVRSSQTRLETIR